MKFPVPSQNNFPSPRILPETQIILPANPFFVPMANVPVDIQENIWRRVVEFVLGAPISEGMEPHGYKDSSTRRTLTLVSKTFNVSFEPL